MAPNSDTIEAEVNAPEWLNTAFFTKVLHSCESDETIKVIDFKLSPASQKGDNYACDVYRANVQYEQPSKHIQSISMIIKAEQEIIAKELASKNPTLDVFKIEAAMYSEILPKFHQLLREAGDDTVLGPRCLYHSDLPHKVIVLEDIVPLGYSMLRDRHLTLEEVKLAYLKLAKWHALSYKLSQEHPDLFNIFRDDVVKVATAGINEFMTSALSIFIEMLETQPKLRAFKPYFEAMQPGFIEKCQAMCSEYWTQPRSDTHYVLCHGDFHRKNMMFKRNAEGDQLQDIMFFDFQLCYMGAMDLEILYSMIMLLSKELRLHHSDELIYHYFSSFTETLKRVGYEGKLPKMLEFQQMMMRHSCFRILLMVTFLAFWNTAEKSKLDITSLMGPTGMRKNWYYDSDYLAELEEILPRMLHMGLLDN